METELFADGDPSFRQKFDAFRYSAFRFEALAEYRGSGEDEAIAAFQRGDRNPPPDPDDVEWEAMIHRNRAAGRVMHRVHAVAEPLTDYLRFELSWGYPPHLLAGEDIRIIDVTDGWPDELPRRDFHLFDNSELYDALYADDGTWLGVERIYDPARIVQACRWRDALWHYAMPLTDYFARHPDLAARAFVSIS
jgi:hypothetical protein